MSRKECREIFIEQKEEREKIKRSIAIKKLRINRLLIHFKEKEHFNEILPEEYEILKEALELLRGDGSEYEDD